MDSGISGTYPLYCHWHWIFPPHRLALNGGGFSGSLQDEITPNPLSLSRSEIESFLLSNLHSYSSLCSTAFL